MSLWWAYPALLALLYFNILPAWTSSWIIASAVVNATWNILGVVLSDTVVSSVAQLYQSKAIGLVDANEPASHQARFVAKLIFVASTILLKSAIVKRRISSFLLVMFDSDVMLVKYKTSMNHIDIDYELNGREYTIRIPQKRKLVLPVTTTFLHNGRDVTRTVKQFLGPSHNFHGIVTTPALLGYDSLATRYVSGNEDQFESDDILLTMQHTKF